jgi:hypothetical protein
MARTKLVDFYGVTPATKTLLEHWDQVMGHPEFINNPPEDLSSQGLIFKEKRLLPLSEVFFNYDQNQIRALGTKESHIRHLQGSFERGYDPCQKPPVVIAEPGEKPGEYEYSGCDGNHRYALFRRMGFTNFPVWIYERTPDCKLSFEAIISGAGTRLNSHQIAMGASYADIAKAALVKLEAWQEDLPLDVNGDKPLPPNGEVAQWVREIAPHLSGAKCTDIATKVRKKAFDSTRVYSWTQKEGQKFVSEVNPAFSANSVEILAGGYDEYRRRALWKAIGRYMNEGTTTPIAMYTKGLSEMAAVKGERRKLIEDMEKELQLLCEFVHKYESGGGELYKFVGALPQVIKEEDFTKLVEV